MNVGEFIQQVISLVKTEAYPHNETNVEDWIIDGDIDGATPQQIADEWDELNA